MPRVDAPSATGGGRGASAAGSRASPAAGIVGDRLLPMAARRLVLGSLSVVHPDAAATPIRRNETMACRMTSMGAAARRVPWRPSAIPVTWAERVRGAAGPMIQVARSRTVRGVLNFNHLYYFHVTAGAGGVKAAAERLGVTQP